MKFLDLLLTLTLTDFFPPSTSHLLHSTVNQTNEKCELGFI